jgi:hypothetical protein
MSKTMIIAPKTIIQLEISYPAIDVFRLNHSMTFLPQHAYPPHLLVLMRTGGKRQPRAINSRRLVSLVPGPGSPGHYSKVLNEYSRVKSCANGPTSVLGSWLRKKARAIDAIEEKPRRASFNYTFSFRSVLENHSRRSLISRVFHSLGQERRFRPPRLKSAHPR